MSATVAAALKKIAVYILTDKKALKVVGGIVLGIIIIIIMPIVALLGIFTGSVDIDTDRLHEMIAEQQSVAIESWSNVETAMTNAGYDPLRIQEAQALFTFALYDHASEPDFASKLVGCFAQEQTDEELISATNAAFGTNIEVSDFTNVMSSIRTSHIDISDYVDPTTKNNLDLVQWAIFAEEQEWGYVWGTYGEVLDDTLLGYKIQQYPDVVGSMAAYIESKWLGGRTSDCVGLIKGYGWFDPINNDINYASNGMPDIRANDMYNNATEKGVIDTIPEIPGLAVWHEGHIGVYIGNGYVIHASNTVDGVKKNRLNEVSWTHWLKIPYITYTEETEESQ